MLGKLKAVRSAAWRHPQTEPPAQDPAGGAWPMRLESAADLSGGAVPASQPTAQREEGGDQFRRP